MNVWLEGVPADVVAARQGSGGGSVVPGSARILTYEDLRRAGRTHGEALEAIRGEPERDVRSGMLGEPPAPPVPPEGGIGTQVELTVARFDTRDPVAGAEVQVFAVFGDPANPSGLQLVASGQTNASGDFFFSAPAAVAPVPSVYRFLVTKAPDVSRKLDVPYGSVVKPLIGICPASVPDPVVCEIGERQFKTAEQLSILNAEWNGPNGFTFDQAHAYLENLDGGPKDARLKEYWIGDLSWGLMDFGIPPGEWPAVLAGRKAVRAVLEEPPWPDIGGKDWFFR